MPSNFPTVEIYSNCSNLDLATGKCRRSGQACQFAAGEHHACGEATFVARVVKGRDEFQMLVNANQEPANGFIPVRTCRQICVSQAAGVHVNSIGVHGAEQSLLQLQTDDDGSIRYESKRGAAAIRWSNGQFSVAED